MLVVVGSWIWVALMSINLRAWKKDNPGATVPLAMFGNVAGAYLWAWTSVGAAIEVLVLILPASLGFTDTIDAGLARVFFSWTLHAIVYFWLMPAYIAFYTIVPRAIGGRLYSDTMGRVAFVLFLVFSMPIGIHHLFADPQVGAGFKFVHAVMTAMVSVPTLLTVFTIVASVEIAARLRGGKGVFGWVKALPWDNPMMLAVTFSFVMLGFGGAGGIINMSYQLNETIHNTQWVTGHFHLIFAGAIVIMYFMIAYDLWPQLTSCAPLSDGLDQGAALAVVRRHAGADDAVALRRAARHAAPHGVFRLHASRRSQPQAWTVTVSTIGGLMLVVSALLLRLHPGARARKARRRARAVHVQRAGASRARARRVALNGFALWVAMMIALTVVNYGFPIAQLALAEGDLGAGHSDREPVMAEPGTYSWRNPLGPLERRSSLVVADASSRCSSASSGCRRRRPTSARRASGRASAARPACPANWGAAAEPARRRARVDATSSSDARWRARAPATPIGRGATLALSMHDVPRRAGRERRPTRPTWPASIRKSSSSSCTTTRTATARAPIMQALAASSPTATSHDLAAYYASLPKARTAPTTYDETLPALVRVGDPLRNIAPCVSCHGGIDQKLGTPWLEGMPKGYLVAQLDAFASGARRNDSHAQMRNMVRAMTPQRDRGGRRSSTRARRARASAGPSAGFTPGPDAR